MITVRITLIKQLADRRYAYKKTDLDPFDTEYTVQIAGPFNIPQLEECAKAIALVESHLYPSFILFPSAKVKPVIEAGTIVSGGRAFTVPLEGLRGQAETLDDDVLASSQAIAVYHRNVVRGDGGRMSFPHAVTAREFSLYQLHDTVPARFQDGDEDAEGTTSAFSFSRQVIETVKASNGALVMKHSPGKESEPSREVLEFVFGGFGMKTVARKRKPTAQTLREAGRKSADAAQNRLDELAEDAQRVKDVVLAALPTFDEAALLEPFKAKAREVYDQIEFPYRFRLKWPDIFGSL